MPYGALEKASVSTRGLDRREAGDASLPVVLVLAVVNLEDGEGLRAGDAGVVGAFGSLDVGRGLLGGAVKLHRQASSLQIVRSG